MAEAPTAAATEPEKQAAEESTVTPTATTGEEKATDEKQEVQAAGSGDDDEPKSKEGDSAKGEMMRRESSIPVPELIVEHIRVMQAGCDMMKLKGSKQYHRTFSLDEELTAIIWNSASKKPYKARIPLNQVKEVRHGPNTENFKSSGKVFDEDKCFSVIYGTDYKTLDLVSQNPNDVTMWCNGIKALQHHTDSAARKSQARDRYIKSLFTEADKNGDGTLDFSEIIKLMKQLNVGLSKRMLKKKFKQVDDDLNGTLDYDEFYKLFHELGTRPELWRLFIKHKSTSDYMTAEDLQTFLELEQRTQPVPLEDCNTLIDLYECSAEGKQGHKLSFDGFTAFMLGIENDIFNYNHKAIYQDMTQPLSHYWINSSHNTYLLGDQLRSESSVEAYIRALQSGCRCVELDCWDGSNDEPIIYHGHTLTTKILFKDVIQAIKDHGFSTSPYPVILSIENHCSVEQQAVMAKHLKEILGDMLYEDPVDDGKEFLPSPEDLHHKVLIKGKKLSKDLEDNEDDGDVSDEDEANEIDPHDIEVAKHKAESGEAASDQQPTSPTQPGLFRRTFSFRRGRERGESATASSATPGKDQTDSGRKHIKLNPHLSRCVNHVQSVSFKSFQHSLSHGKCHQMSSFGEEKAFKLRGQSGGDFVQYNKKQISRIYPAGKRIDSSNYDPIEMWNIGCQMVALNFQTAGTKMDYNTGKFKQNGNCGYLLKPQVMRSEVSLFDPSSREPVPGIIAKTYTLKIISGQHLPKPLRGSKTGEIIDPYVRIDIKGLASDCKSFKTKYVNDNGFNPKWDETFTFTAQFPDLCLVRFSVYDADTFQDDFIGQFTLPLDSVEKGYRHVHLYSPTWERIEHATIYVHVTINEAAQFNVKKLLSSKASIEKARRTRKYPEPKFTHLSDIDKIFRGSTYLIRESRDLKGDFQFYLLKFKGLVDAKSEASLRECIWLMMFKAKNAKVEIQLKKKGEIYEVEAISGHVPSLIATLFDTFNQLNGVIVPILDRADDITNQLTQIFDQSFKKRKDIPTVMQQYGFNPKKSAKVMECYCWTMQIIQSEIFYISTLKRTAEKSLTEILEAAQKVQMEIVMEKVPTTDERKSADLSVVLAVDTKDEKPDEGEAKAEEKKKEEPAATEAATKDQPKEATPPDSAVITVEVAPSQLPSGEVAAAESKEEAATDDSVNKTEAEPQEGEAEGKSDKEDVKEKPAEEDKDVSTSANQENEISLTVQAAGTDDPIVQVEVKEKSPAVDSMHSEKSRSHSSREQTPTEQQPSSTDDQPTIEIQVEASDSAEVKIVDEDSKGDEDQSGQADAENDPPSEM